MCEDVDLTHKAHLPILTAIYKKYSGRRTLPGSKPSMSLEEFRDLCQIVGLVNDNFATREIDLCFNLAMMTQVDELYKKRHMDMSFVEFIEAIARAADLASIEVESVEGEENRIDSTTLPLADKILNAMRLLFKQCPSSLQSNFRLPTKESVEAMKYKKGSNK